MDGDGARLRPRRVVALGALASTLLVAGCDRDVSTPPREIVLAATVTETGGSGDRRIGAFLVAIEGSASGIESDEGRILVHPESDRTVVALVMTVPRTAASFRMTVAGGTTPAVEILQVSDGENALRPDPEVFSVDVRPDGG